MTTPSSPTPLFDLLYRDPLFRGPYYNRRQLLPAKPKPNIRRLKGTKTWVCVSADHPQLQGFGLTVGDAYRMWKDHVGRESV